MGKKTYYKWFKTQKSALRAARAHGGTMTDFLAPFGYKSGYVAATPKKVKGWKVLDANIHKILAW